MSAVPIEAKSTPALGVCLLTGRIASRRRVNTQNGALFLTVIKLPAADEFSNPQTVELRSESPLGEVGDTWRGKVQVGGYGRSYAVDDEVTGRKVTVQTANVTLTVLA
jgi:hypothetical protein